MLYLKALHIIALVSWFAGLFYLPRLFVYDVEANDKPQAKKEAIQEQLRIMQRRLYRGIMWPAMVLTWTFGLSLAYVVDAFSQPWFHFKLLFVLILTGYHLFCGKIRVELSNNLVRFNSKQLRLFNEIPTIILITIAFVIYLKTQFDVVWGGGAAVLGLIVLCGVMYKKSGSRF
jgi:putative membrane protein